MISRVETGGEVEADETFIGGKARNMHVSKRERRITGTGGKDTRNRFERAIYPDSYSSKRFNHSIRDSR